MSVNKKNIGTKPLSGKRITAQTPLFGRQTESYQATADKFWAPAREYGKWTGQILDVDTNSMIAKFDCDSGGPQGWATWVTPWVRGDTEHDGIYAIPVKGERCLVEEIHGRFFITGFFIEKRGFISGANSPEPVPDHSGKRNQKTEDTVEAPSKTPQQGEVKIGARAKNYIIVRPEGSIEAVASSLCRWFLTPVNNWLKVIARNFSMVLAGGQLIWNRNPELPKSNLHVEIYANPELKRLANYITVDAGSDDELQGAARPDGLTATFNIGPVETIKVTMLHDGTMQITTVGDVSWVTRNYNINCLNYNVNATGTTVLNSVGNVTVESETSIDFIAP